MVSRLSETDFKILMKNSHARIKNNVQPSPAYMESYSCNEAPRPYENEAFNTPVIITVHSFRYRLADPDGLCAKYHIDAIVKAGLLVDDTTKEIQEVRFRQTKISKPEEERTVITLESLI